MVKKKKNDNIFNYKYIMGFLIIIIIILLIDLANSKKVINYHVNNIKLDNYIFTSNEEKQPKATLYFNLYSNSNSHKLNKFADIFFRCHNKITDEFYYLDVFDRKEGFNIEHVDSVNINYLEDNNSTSNNTFEIDNSVINENAKDIDYCSFIGIENNN
jgi:hypothetical protein